MSLPPHTDAFEFTQAPHPDWQAGEPQAAPVPERATVSLPVDALKSRYRTFISAIVPRPIALVSTVDAESGVVNVAPFSFFNMVSFDPPILMIAPVRAGDGGKKDTLRNIEQSGEFVVNVMSEHFVEAANHCSGNFLPEESELEAAGLTPQPSVTVKPPRIADAYVSIECRLRKIDQVRKGERGEDDVDKQGEPTAEIVTGYMDYLHVEESVWDSEREELVLERFRPVSRLGGRTYGSTKSAYEIPRPRFDHSQG